MVQLEFCNVEKVIFAVLYLQPLGHPYSVVINWTVFYMNYMECHEIKIKYFPHPSFFARLQLEVQEFFGLNEINGTDECKHNQWRRDSGGGGNCTP